MSVSDGQPVDANTTNNAFVSKISTTSQKMVAPLDLDRASGSGAQVADVQQAINTNIADIALKADLTDPRFPTTDEKAALVGTDGVASTSNKYVTDSDPRLQGAEQTETIAETQTATNFTNMVFDELVTHAVTIDYALRRRNDASEEQGVGQIVLQYKLDAAVWEVSNEESSNEDIGVTFAVTTAAGVGTVNYTSDTLGGTGYNGELLFRVRTQFGRFTT